MIWTRQHTVFLVVALAFVAVVIGLAVPLALCRDGLPSSGAKFGETGAYYYNKVPQKGYTSFLGHKRPYGPYRKRMMKKSAATKKNGPLDGLPVVNTPSQADVFDGLFQKKQPTPQSGDGLLGGGFFKKRSVGPEVTAYDMYKTHVSPNNKLAHVPQTKPPYAGEMDLNDAPKEEDISHVLQFYDKPRMLQQQYKSGISSKDLFVGGHRRKLQSDLAMRVKQRTKK